MEAGVALTILSTSLKVASTALSTAKVVNEIGLIDKVMSLIKGSTDILLLGKSGAGKTQFINSLSEFFSKPVHINDRTFEVSDNKKKFEGKYYNFIDTPGHVYAISNKVDTIKKIDNDKCKMIVMVVCYGFCESSTNNPPSKRTLEDYLDKKRKEEIETIKSLDMFDNFLKPKYIVTLINKADLWLSYGENIVVDYYSNGEYSEYIDKSRHIVIPYSSTLKDFYDIKKPSLSAEKINEMRAHFFRILKKAKR